MRARVSTAPSRNAIRSVVVLPMSTSTASPAPSVTAAWRAVASQFADATYLVQATIAMESNGDATSAEQVQGWMTFHESLAKDPQLMEKVAERMRRVISMR